VPGCGGGPGSASIDSNAAGYRRCSTASSVRPAACPRSGWRGVRHPVSRRSPIYMCPRHDPASRPREAPPGLTRRGGGLVTLEGHAALSRSLSAEAQGKAEWWVFPICGISMPTARRSSCRSRGDERPTSEPAADAQNWRLEGGKTRSRTGLPNRYSGGRGSTLPDAGSREGIRGCAWSLKGSR